MFMYAIAGEPGTYHLKSQADEALIAVLRAENERLRAALQDIASLAGLTLLAPSLNEDCDRAHQLGANKAYNEAAGIAHTVLRTSQP